MLPMRTPFTTSTSSTPSRCSRPRRRPGARRSGAHAARARARVWSISGRRYGPIPSTTLTRPVAAANVPSVTRSGRMRAPQGACSSTQSSTAIESRPFCSQPCRAGPAVAATATAGTPRPPRATATGIHLRTARSRRAPPRPGRAPPGRARAGRSRTRGRSRTGRGSGCGSGRRRGTRPEQRGRRPGRDHAERRELAREPAQHDDRRGAPPRSGAATRARSGRLLSVVALSVKSCMIAAGRTYQWPWSVGECRTVPVRSDAVGSTPVAERGVRAVPGRALEADRAARREQERDGQGDGGRRDDDQPRQDLAPRPVEQSPGDRVPAQDDHQRHHRHAVGGEAGAEEQRGQQRLLPAVPVAQRPHAQHERAHGDHAADVLGRVHVEVAVQLVVSTTSVRSGRSGARRRRPSSRPSAHRPAARPVDATHRSAPIAGSGARPIA